MLKEKCTCKLWVRILKTFATRLNTITHWTLEKANYCRFKTDNISFNILLYLRRLSSNALFQQLKVIGRFTNEDLVSKDVVDLFQECFGVSIFTDIPFVWFCDQHIQVVDWVTIVLIPARYQLGDASAHRKPHLLVAVSVTSHSSKWLDKRFESNSPGLWVYSRLLMGKFLTKSLECTAKGCKKRWTKPNCSLPVSMSRQRWITIGGQDWVPEGCARELLLSRWVPLAGDQDGKSISIECHKSCCVGGPAWKYDSALAHY